MSDPNILVQLPRQAVVGGGTATIIGRTVTAFRPRYLIVPKSIAQDFAIVDFKIGKQSQFHGEDGMVPAEVFAGDAEQVLVERDGRAFLSKANMDHPLELQVDACTPHHIISITVSNQSPVARNFMAVVAGTKIE